MSVLVSDLRKINGLKTPAVHLDGYYKSGDGGGGDFTFFSNDHTAFDKGLVFEPDPTIVPSLPPGRWKRNWAGALNVRWFGAQGDGVADDYDALQAAVAAINAKKSLVLQYPKGIYHIARVKLDCGPKCTPKNDDIIFQDCDGLQLLGSNAVIDVKGDFGRADSGIKSVQPFVFKNCQNVVMNGFELNGNVDKMTRTNKNFTQGGSGIVFGYGSANYTLENLFVHHFPTDGIYLGLSDPSATKQKPAPCDQHAVLRNVSCKFNARDGLSCISLLHGEFYDCEFSENGRAAGSYGMDAGALGVDIEPTFWTLEKPGDLSFYNCRCENNGLGAISVSARNCRFFSCIFWGTGYYSVVSQQADHLFEDCQIFGECANWYNPNLPEDPSEPLSPTNPAQTQFSTKYVGCHFEDKEFGPIYGVYRTLPPYGACLSSNRANVILSNCTVIGNKTRGVQFGEPSDTSKPHSLTHCTITHQMTSLLTPSQDPAHGHQSQLVYALVDDVHFKEHFNLPPKPTWNIYASNVTKITTPVVDGPCVVWKDF